MTIHDDSNCTVPNRDRVKHWFDIAITKNVKENPENKFSLTNIHLPKHVLSKEKI